MIKTTKTLSCTTHINPLPLHLLTVKSCFRGPSFVDKMSQQNNYLRPHGNQNSNSNKTVKGPMYSIHNDELVPTVSTTIREYLRESTIHGLKFLLEPHWWQKMFWIVAIVICATLAVYFNVQVNILQDRKNIKINEK